MYFVVVTVGRGKKTKKNEVEQEKIE